MSRTILAFCIASGLLASAAILPDKIGPAQRISVQPAASESADRALWDEIGLQVGEQADYGTFTATAWRFRDATGALAAYEWLRPNSAGLLLADGNYVLRFEGRTPAPEAAKSVLAQLPGLSHSQLAVLTGYLPTHGLIPNSERYVLGPASLQRFQPAIPASAAAFQLGAEGQLGRYRVKSGDLDLAIFTYPTPGMARQQAVEFEKVPGAVVKRTGPLVAVVLGAQDPAAAQKLLGDVNYEAKVSWSAPIPLIVRPQTAGQIVMGAVTLAGVVLAFCVTSGLLFGGIKVLRQKFGPPGANEPMILLHLREK